MNPFSTFCPCLSYFFSPRLMFPGVFYYFLKFFYFLKYLFERENTSSREWLVEGEGEAGSPQSREPHAGLDPRTLGS